MKNSYLVIISILISTVIIYLALFIYTFFNFNNEFPPTIFKSLENLNFHKLKKINYRNIFLKMTSSSIPVDILDVKYRCREFTENDSPKNYGATIH